MKHYILAILIFSSCVSHNKKSAPCEITDGPNPYRTIDTSLFKSAFQNRIKTAAIVTHNWRQISGPKNATINCASCWQTSVTGLTTPGDYYFELAVKDNQDSTAADTVKITVNSAVLLIHFTKVEGTATKFYNRINCSYEGTERIQLTLEASFDSFRYHTVESFTTSSGSASFKDYAFQKTTWYRIKQVDETGRIAYSQTIQILNTPSVDELIIWSPVQSTLNITFVSTINQYAYISIYDMYGKIVAQYAVNAIIGFNRYADPSFASKQRGMYMAVVTAGVMRITTKFQKL